jgi:acyl-CoA synthetase (AMP-forming)/AMP-acid ligase II
MKEDLTIASHLTRLAQECPIQTALIYPGGQMSYRELEETSQKCAQGLVCAGFSPGARSVLMVKPGPELMVLAFALLRIGAIPVLVDPGMGWSKLKRCLGEALPDAFIGTTIAHIARLVLGWAKDSIKTRIAVGPFARFFGIPYSKILQTAAPADLKPCDIDIDDPAAIVFTSGSTGVPKGVVYTHRMFNEQARLLRDTFNIEPGEVDLATFPLFALFDPALRMTTVFPKMDFTRPGQVQPQAIIGAIHRSKATHMFGSPALLSKVGRFGESKNVELSSLKRVLSAGAPVASTVLEQFSSMLSPKAQIHTPYGATEALPVSSISHREVLEIGGSAEGKGTCVGLPVEGVQVAVIRISEDPVEEWTDDLVVEPGTVGELVVWGDNVSREYFRRPNANRLAKIPMPDGQVRHRMGDLGYLDKAGKIWFCGRKSHRVITSNGTLYTVSCEGVFNRHADVHRTALVGVGDPPDQVPVLCVEVEKHVRQRQLGRIRQELFELGSAYDHTKVIQRILFHPAFPVDIRHNAKIFREKLATWAKDRIGGKHS